MDPINTPSYTPITEPPAAPPSVPSPHQHRYDALIFKKRMSYSDESVETVAAKALKPNPPALSSSAPLPAGKQYAIKSSAMSVFQIPDGNYKFTSPQTGIEYSGKWQGGEMVRGTAQEKQYLRVGTFHNFMLHGGGIIKWLEKRRYESNESTKECVQQYESMGNFKEDKLHGTGFRCIPLNDRELIEKGTFERDQLHGTGLRLVLSADKVETILYEEGEFENGKLHGYGVREKNGNLWFKGNFIYGEFIEP